MRNNTAPAAHSFRPAVALAGGLALVATLILPVAADQQAPAACRLTGKATSGTRALPGVSILLRAAERLVAATSTEIDGSFTVTVPPGATYRLTADLTAFGRVERDITMGSPPCEATADIEMALTSRSGSVGSAGSAGSAGSVGSGGSAGSTGSTGSIGSTPAGRGAAVPGQRFETLNVQTEATAEAGLLVSPPDREAAEAATRLLLPPGFSTTGPTEAVAMNGNMATVDRGMMNDRLAALGRGDIDPITGQFMQVAAADAAGGFGGFGEFGQVGGRGGRGGPGGMGPGSMGPGGRLGGRGIQQRPYQFTSNYSYGGSALDAAPYQLRPDSPVSQNPYGRHTYGGTVGGPVRIPGIYNGTNRTSFQATYSGNRSGNLFDQYATVPGAALRAGDFSGRSVSVIDPLTGLPFTGNQIPADRIHPASQALLQYIPLANLPGDTRNFHYTTTRNSSSDSVTVRVNHTLMGTGRGGRGGAGGGRGGLGGPAGQAGPAGRGRGQTGTAMNLNAQVQYRRNTSEQVNVFPTLGGRTEGSSLSLPVGLNIQRGRTSHAINVSFSRSSNRTRNQYAFVTDVAGLAGIGGVSTDPFDWGVPNLSFTSFSNLRDTSPTVRRDRRLSVSYQMTRPIRTHTIRLGGDFSQDWSSALTNANPRGAFVYTGLFTANGGKVPRDSALDFADFLLGLPQQASIQYGPGTIDLRGRMFTGFFQDDWRRSGTLTFNFGVRYEFLQPYTEDRGRMVNLDATPGFTAVVPVLAGEEGLFSGVFPAALLNADANNVAPRVGMAWRVAPGTILRAGYGITYNSGSYASIARQLTGQPPFASTSTSLGTLADPLSYDDPFVLATPSTTTNNYGIDLDYVLGLIQTWTVDLSRDFGPWNVGAGYIGTKGSDLDMLRAPNRGPTGLLLSDVQAFTWQSSQGSSILKAGSFRVRRRPIAGIGFGATYTLAKSMDNTTATGGAATVAQDDRNLDAEWALSSFDRRHQLAADVQLELPFGPNRPWLNNGGFWAAIAEGWRAAMNFTWQSGAPYTPTVTGSAADVARGTTGGLRANYSGEPIQINNPSIDRFFNTAAFSVPQAGTFGDAGRNLIIGPGSRSLNATFSRDIRMGGIRTLTFDVRVNNLLNLVNYTGIDTRVNSPTFGQVTSVQGMRSAQLNFRFRF